MKKPDKKTKIISINYCKNCVEPWSCFLCGKIITSNSKVVRRMKIDGEFANYFFCTRKCFSEFRDYTFDITKKFRPVKITEGKKKQE